MGEHSLVPTPSQTAYPWRATARTVFQAALAILVVLPVVIATSGIPTTGVVGMFLAVAAAITRVMALPVVNELLRRFAPWLLAEPA
ncbi:hypothetical protein [Nocardia bovistercoris]|uniref:Uncharacterized protein n=1 Tax=Nocardia bovistercoris TaxID=2785916 RepID=A0A931ICD6_9NOCA|nr:hypothetical protein [Nocardia bovistercoris]MBH0778829.1 hypothetical protein [Nocardia bovistercoris]